MQQRLSRQDYYMKLAEVVSQRATCTRAQVGAILVNNITGRVVSMGYNGAPKGGIHCIDHSCLIHDGHCIRTIHAEANAIANLERSYNNLDMYCTHQPCLNCMKLLIAVNVRKVYYKYHYPSEARELLYKEMFGTSDFMEQIPCQL